MNAAKFRSELECLEPGQLTPGLNQAQALDSRLGSIADVLQSMWVEHDQLTAGSDEVCLVDTRLGSASTGLRPTLIEFRQLTAALDRFWVDSDQFRPDC